MQTNGRPVFQESGVAHPAARPMLQQPPFLDPFSAHAQAMSAECESAPPQSLAGAAKPLVGAPALSTSASPPDRHSAAGISYEGRVSVIPPLAGYEATMRAAMELDRAHAHAREQQQMSMDAAAVAARMQSERGHYDPLQMQQELRRLYEQRVRLQEASHLYAAQREEHAQQAYAQHDALTPKEEPMSVAHEEDEQQDVDMSDARAPSPPQPISEAEQHLEVVVKEEPAAEGQSAGREGEARAFEADSVLRFARPDHHAEPTRSPIDKAGESPDLPTDSARTQAHAAEEQNDSFRGYESAFRHGEDALSPYGESYQGSDERMPSSVEADVHDDSMDSSCIPDGGDMNPLSRLQHALELSGVMGKEGEGGDKQAFQCHLCSYSGSSRFHFDAHLNTHYDHKCAKCEFTARTEPKLREHMQDEHGLSPDSNEDLEGIRVPRVNAQGKVKTFKCKQCEYVAITKGDFWEHARTHIKSEKLLTCPKCPFVTEYKHHLEYHLRNHFGSKPFKCNKCNYSCVNKSMLNSHMKSHSNIYQYRCADCTYATKYCHSLKLHLRKYGHNPAMVLNPDGSPNPIPIIDVYGTRRGPKLKKDENGMPILPPHYQIQAQLLKAQMQAGATLPQAPQTPTSPREGSKPPQGRTPAAMPQTPRAPPPHSPFSYPYPSMIPNFQSSSPILSRALEKSPEEAPKALEGREQLRELLLERERLTQKNPLSPGGAFKCPQCEFSTDLREVFSQHVLLHAAAERRDDADDGALSPKPLERSLSPERRPASPRAPAFHPHQALQPPASEPGAPYSPLAAAHNLKEYLARAMNPFLYQQMMSGQIHPALGLQQHLQRFAHPALHGPRLTPADDEHGAAHEPPQGSPHEPHAHPQAHSPNDDGVLDLSKEQTPPQQGSDLRKVPSSEPRSESQASLSPHHSSPQSSSPPRSETSTPPSKSRRKGRAFKLERIAMRLSESAEGESSGHDEDSRRDDEEPPRRPTEASLPPLVPLEPLQDDDAHHAQKMQEESQQPHPEQWRGAHQCQFCDMAFKDVVMYTMHMGYHGYRNPFTCNMCGHQAADKVAFFLHIARSSHS